MDSSLSATSGVASHEHRKLYIPSPSLVQKDLHIDRPFGAPEKPLKHIKALLIDIHPEDASTDDFVELFKQLPSLEKLVFSTTGEIRGYLDTPKGISFCRTLQVFEATGFCVDGETLDWIPSCTALQELRLNGTNIKGKHLSEIAKNRSLTSFGMYTNWDRNDPDDDDLVDSYAPIGGMAQLQVLDLGKHYNNVSEDDLRAIVSGCSALRELRVHTPSLTSLDCLASLNSLQTVEIWTQLTPPPAALQAVFSKCTSLDKMTINGVDHKRP